MNNLQPDPFKTFNEEKAKRIASYPGHTKFQDASDAWMLEAFGKSYMYNFLAMGRPIIQLPADIVAISELIWELRPDVIVETGIAHGGSIIHSASQLALLDMCDAIEKGETLDPASPKRRVIAVDIDIRAHNRAALDAHPMIGRIHMIEGSSVAREVVEQVHAEVGDAERVLVCLDSNHTHDHVLQELRAYAPLTSPGSYCIVFDTIVEYLPPGFFQNRPWNRGDSPATAISAYLQECDQAELKDRHGVSLNFEVDAAIDHKLVLSAAPGGFLRRNPQ